MLYRDIVKLIDTQAGTDADGYKTTTEETGTEVFADVQSVRRSEYYSGRQAGVELAAAFLVRACDYKNQRLVYYDGKRYRIERVFVKGGRNSRAELFRDKGVKE